jgi:hypothetical protein
VHTSRTMCPPRLRGGRMILRNQQQHKPRRQAGTCRQR